MKYVEGHYYKRICKIPLDKKLNGGFETTVVFKVLDIYSSEFMRVNAIRDSSHSDGVAYERVLKLKENDSRVVELDFAEVLAMVV